MAGACELVHGTALALAGTACGPARLPAGAVILGASGAGKSDLALRCLGLPPSAVLPWQAVLVSDDQVTVAPGAGGLVASPPAAIAGRIELRGVGIVTVPFAAAAEVRLVVALTPREHIERLPEPGEMQTIAGVPVALLRLDPRDASAPLKLLLALAGLAGVAAVRR